MKKLSDVESFGGTDADSDELLLQAFEAHDAYQNILQLKKHLIIGKKGSGKTAIFKKILNSNTHDFFSVGHTFNDYPWHHHQKQAIIGIPETDKYIHSWKYLILMTISKILINNDQSIYRDDESLEASSKIERFITDTYGSTNPELSQIFLPQTKIKLQGTGGLNLSFIKAETKIEEISIDQLPTVIQDINKSLLNVILQCLNVENKYFIAFDRLDMGFNPSDDDYKNRLIGLLLASKDINLAAKEAGKKLFVVIFLRDDIYECLRFEDKNKLTENFVSLIEWDTQKTKNTLKRLMERRFNILLSENKKEKIAWESVFNEERELTGHQKNITIYLTEHILDLGI